MGQSTFAIDVLYYRSTTKVHCPLPHDQVCLQTSLVHRNFFLIFLQMAGKWHQFVYLIGVVLMCAVMCSLACNEAVCASLVSKCLLLKSCECNMMDKDNCTCCKDCHRCLNKLYTECCSCVGKMRLLLSCAVPSIKRTTHNNLEG